MYPSSFLIGVNSDGTAFDSMHIKHAEAFIPAALEIWPMRAGMAAAFSEIEKTVNLFSAQRGINRYSGLLETFTRLEKAFPGEKSLPDLKALRLYVDEETRFSPATLKAWLAAHPSAALEKVLAWSNRADELYANAAENMQPFPGVREALEEASESASVVVMSSASGAELEKNWTAGGLMPYVDLVLSQEDGGRDAQLQQALAPCGEDVKALVIGDTISDARAAHEAGAMFYPIMPGEEEASWTAFREKILPLFLAGNYVKSTEALYYNRLKAMLK